MSVLRNGSGRIDKLKGFLGYLRRHLGGRGGIRRQRVPLYLAEQAWRYNHRQLSQQQQIEELLKVLKKSLYSSV